MKNGKHLNLKYVRIEKKVEEIDPESNEGTEGSS